MKWPWSIIHILMWYEGNLSIGLKVIGNTNLHPWGFFFSTSLIANKSKLLKLRTLSTLFILFWSINRIIEKLTFQNTHIGVVCIWKFQIIHQWLKVLFLDTRETPLFLTSSGDPVPIFHTYTSFGVTSLIYSQNHLFKDRKCGRQD